MMLAKVGIRNGVVGILAVAVIGCSTVERVILPRASAQRVVVQQDYIDFEQIQELSRFSTEMLHMSATALAARLPGAEREFAANPNALNRFKYALLLIHAGENQENYAKALSLFDDKAAADLQYNLYWAFFAEQLKALIASEAKLIEANNRLLEERTKVLADSERLTKELQTSSAELNKVQEQLNALKSIEKSILEREIGEEKGTP